MPETPWTDDEETTYEPSTVEVNRGREQGLGVGQKDLDYQQDPQGAVPAEREGDPPLEPRLREPDPLPPELDPPPRSASDAASDPGRREGDRPERRH